MTVSLFDYLKVEPKARERKNKNRAIANLLIKNYSLSIDKELLITLVKEANTLDREWRKILEQNVTLRGSDYNEKEKLVDNKLKELGYK